jgi:hypothetical protein
MDLLPTRACHYLNAHVDVVNVMQADTDTDAARGRKTGCLSGLSTAQIKVAMC